MSIEDGFPGQRLLVLPRPRIAESLTLPGTTHLLVTDCGYFPEARAHGLVRTTPIAQAVIFACTAGRGWCRIDGVTHPVAAGQVVVLPPGHAHSYGSDASDPWTLWFLHVDGRDLPEFLAAAGMTSNAPVRTLSDVYRVVALIEEAVRELEHDFSAASLLAASGAAWHLLALLASLSNAGDERSTVIEQARNYLRSHVADHVSVDELAETAKLSPSHFAALFKRQIGVPVLQYQTQQRMARARELLDTSDLNVAAISRAVGYNDPFYFSRQFRAVHGVTALQYRSQRKG